MSKVRLQNHLTDVAGVEEAKAGSLKWLTFSKILPVYRDRGSIPKGVPVGRPSGTGKTLMAKAVAGEAGVPFQHFWL